jgi:hypothetical protein
MAEYSTNIAGVVIALDHQETQALLDAVPGGTPALTGVIGGILTAASLPAPWVAAITLCVTTHILLESLLIKNSDQGYGVYLTLPWPAVWFGQHWLVVPTSRPAPTAPPPPEWAATNNGVFGTQDPADSIRYTIHRGAVAANEVHFRLILGPDSSGWKKAIDMPDGLGSSWLIEAYGRGDWAENALWADQVLNGQSLMFIKAKEWGRMVPVQPLRPLDALQGGDRVDFVWERDT